MQKTTESLIPIGTPVVVSYGEARAAGRLDRYINRHDGKGVDYLVVYFRPYGGGVPYDVAEPHRVCRLDEA